MKSRSRLLPLFVTLTMLLPAAAGCAPEEEKSAETTLPPDTVTEAGTTAAESEPALTDTVPADLTFAGETVSFLVRGGLKAEFVAESITGEVVNDAVLARNRTVEERLGCQLNFIESRAAWSDYNAEIRRSIQGRPENMT